MRRWTDVRTIVTGDSIEDRPGERSADAFILDGPSRGGAPRPQRLAATFDCADLDAALSPDLTLRPDAILLRGATRDADVARLAARLAVAEAEHGLEDRSTGILLAIDRPAGLARMLAGSDPGHVTARLVGILWDSPSLGIEMALPSEPCTDIEAFGRVAVAVGARAAGVPAFVHLAKGLSPEQAAQQCRRAWQSGFTGAMTACAVHLPLIHDAFARPA